MILNLKEFIINGYELKALDILFIFSVISSILVIISKNPIVSVLYLIGLFGSISIYLILLGLEFLALSYLIVYIGAISILFLFILMLINIRISELQNNTNNSIFLSIFILLFLYNTIISIFPNNMANNFKSFINNITLINKELFSNNDNNLITWYTSNNWDTNLSEINHISSIGNILYSTHSIWLLIISYILLLAMIGTISITINNSKIT